VPSSWQCQRVLVLALYLVVMCCACLNREFILPSSLLLLLGRIADLQFCVRRCGLLLPTESVGLSAVLQGSAKTAEPINMPFGLRTWVGPGNHILDGGPDPHGKGHFFSGKGAFHCKV